MDILEHLTQKQRWLAFLEYKREAGHLSETEEAALSTFILGEHYRAIAQKLNGGGFFSVPEMVRINKRFSSKKRNVFVFEQQENFAQKLLCYELLALDDIFAPNLYSFRKNTGVKKAITTLLAHPKLANLYSFKLDISDYFNSVDTSLLLPQLKAVLSENARLYRLMEAMLCEPRALVAGEVCTVKKGILAGSPLSGFLANLFLSELDWSFYYEGVLYARYSDDIIVFAETEQQLQAYRQRILNVLHARHLEVNAEKLAVSKPGEAWNFLGFSYQNGVVDISEVSQQKLKKKMKRKARALARWRERKQLPPEAAVRAFIKYFNKKFFCNSVQHELTWCRWYFPLINSTRGLRQIDTYMQHTIRFLATGKQTKGRYRFRYEQMKALGYRSLVHSFYKFKESGSWEERMFRG